MEEPLDPIMPDPRGRPLEILRSVFGYPSFRPCQEEIIARVLKGGDAFVLMPTGGGKSLCYQIPALIRPGAAVVVSPLISLMKDQVDALKACGVRAACYNSSLERAEARRVLARLHSGELDLLYMAPERLMTPAFLERLKTVPLALFAIDEAHCISQWGHDFRPEYRSLGKLRALFPGVPLLALTATAEPHTRSDIIERLGLRHAGSFVTGFDRPNIRYTVTQKAKAFAQLQEFIEKRPGSPGIVYCLSHSRVDEVAARLVEAGYNAAPYHAGLSDGDRRKAQEGFLRDDIRIIVATVAFGMGIDKPNIRYVVHYDIPKNIESYYQETGRAGRDGLAAEAMLLLGYGDVAVARGIIEKAQNPVQKRIELHKLGAMVGFAEAQSCRRRILLGYFGEKRDGDCRNCDVCLDPPVLTDVTEDARKALSCVYRVEQRFGMAHVVDVLRGSKKERVLNLGHEALSTYGIGAHRSREYWMGLLRHLVHRGFLEQDVGSYSVLRLTPSSLPLLKGEETLAMAEPKAGPAAAPRSSSRRKAGDIDCDHELFEVLKALRKKLADREGVPPFVIFSDLSLAEMAAHLPLDSVNFRGIHGVGDHKLESYGPLFIQEIRRYARLKKCKGVEGE